MQIIIDYDEQTGQLQVQNIPNNMVAALGIMAVATKTVESAFTPKSAAEENRIQPVSGILPEFGAGLGRKR